LKQAGSNCVDDTCVCNGTGQLVWVADYYRWRYQLLCNRGGLIFLEVEGDMEVYDYVGDVAGLKGNPARDAPPLPSPDDYIRCDNCDRLVIKHGRSQKYCSRCAKVASRVRKREWIRKRRSTST